MKVTAGISFAIPIDYAKDFLKRAELRRNGGGNVSRLAVVHENKSPGIKRFCIRCSKRGANSYASIHGSYHAHPYTDSALRTATEARRDPTEHQERCPHLQSYRWFTGRYVRPENRTVLPLSIQQQVTKVTLPLKHCSGGVQTGDIITHVNDEPVMSASNIYKAVESSKVLRLTVIRKMGVLHLKVEPEDL